MKVVESLAWEWHLTFQKWSEVSARCTRLNAAGHEHGIDAQTKWTCQCCEECLESATRYLRLDISWFNPQYPLSPPKRLHKNIFGTKASNYSLLFWSKQRWESGIIPCFKLYHPTHQAFTLGLPLGQITSVLEKPFTYSTEVWPSNFWHFLQSNSIYNSKMVSQWSRFSCCSHWVNHRLCLYGLGPKSHSQKLKRWEIGIASLVCRVDWVLMDLILLI